MTTIWIRVEWPDGSVRLLTMAEYVALREDQLAQTRVRLILPGAA